ncbi:MAG: GIY-YIG nuclease family protein [Candidatus Pacebacteria bacterium]|nr:GIY-YIG nuclease family protein [Candidatus Paceibacterota bacterium]
MEKIGYVYILTNKNNTILYVGVTNDLARRMWEHKNHALEGFTKKYHVDKLVYYESGEDILTAIQREKRLKNWHREWKNNLISEKNPEWKDLSDEL